MSRSEQPAGGPDAADRRASRESNSWRIDRERHVEEWAALLGERVN